MRSQPSHLSARSAHITNLEKTVEPSEIGTDALGNLSDIARRRVVLNRYGAGMAASESDRSEPSQPYGSADDLPTVREMRRLLAGFRLLGVLSRELRAESRQMEKDLERMVMVVDSFYALLGERHWVFNDRLKFDHLADAVEQSSDGAELEARYIQLHRDRLAGDFWWIGQLNRDDSIRARRPQLERAREHYFAGQFDSCTLHLLAVMDGYVNDFQPAIRRGLHARDADDMLAWDSVVGHHLGLTNALQPFRKAFKKRHEAEVNEVFRNGIVHGMVVSFDNEIVATKAWNLLDAVLDWADATEKQAAAQPTENPSLSESWATLKSTISQEVERRRHRSGWAPIAMSSADERFAADPAVQRSLAFLDHWRTRNFGELGTYPLLVGAIRQTRGAAAQHAKRRLGRRQLESYELYSVDHTMPSVAELSGTAVVDGKQFSLKLRWIYQAENGDFVVPPQHGDWRLQNWEPIDCLTPTERPS